MKSIKITTGQLKQIFDKVYEKIDFAVETEIEFHFDYYWKVHMSDAFDLDNEPKLLVGSLFDDWENLQKTISNNQQVTFVDFDRFAAILSSISQELNPPQLPQDLP